MNKAFICIALLCFLSLNQAVFTFEDIDLSLLNPNQTIEIMGAEEDGLLGVAVSKAGDVNGDGVDDFIVGASAASPPGRLSGGIAYVIFGNKSGLPNIDIKNFTQAQGFKVLGVYANLLGCSVSDAGDVNGDGIDDIIIGAWQTETLGRLQAGAAYVIFGSRNGLPDIDVNSFHNTQGFKISGEFSFSFLGRSVSGAGDVNGDGIDDIIVGANGASPFGRYSAGISYVIFGSRNGFPDIDLAELTNTQGFRIMGAASTNNFGDKVSGAGDVNGDGIDDIIAGTGVAVNDSMSYSMSAFVIFGSRNGLPDIDLAVLNSTQGIKISKSAASFANAMTASDAGDVNGDGIADVVVGAWQSTPLNRNYAGIVYVIYGSANGLSDINIDTLTSSQGFSVFGSASGSSLGFSLSSAGDFNNDGVDDILLGAYGSSLLGKQENGAAYVIYGSRNQIANIDLSQLTTEQGFKVTGANQNDSLGCSVRSAGDIDGDGSNDLIVGAFKASPEGRMEAGAAYIILSSQQSQEDRIIVQ